MKINNFFNSLSLKSQDLYNARAALRSYLRWADPKLGRAAEDTAYLESLDTSKIPLSESQINAFASESRTNRNHAVTLRRLLEVKREEEGYYAQAPAYIRHSERVGVLEALLKERNLDFAGLSKILHHVKKRELLKGLKEWHELTPTVAEALDSYLKSLEVNLGFSDNLFPVLTPPPTERQRLITREEKVPLAPQLEAFVEGVRNFYLSPRTSYDGCDARTQIRKSTVNKLCSDLSSFFVFVTQELSWFYSRYRDEFKSDFETISMPAISEGEQNFFLLFRPDLVKLYARYFLPFKAALEQGDINIFVSGKNMETSPKWLQSVRPLFNKSGYLHLAKKSQKIGSELKLSPNDLENWETKANAAWALYGEIDKVCRDNAVASRPRTPKKSKDDQDKAILNKVLEMPLPINVIKLFHQKLRKLLHDLDPSSKLHHDLDQVLFISYFLTALPLRVSNLTSLMIAHRRSSLEGKDKQAVISWDSLKNCAKVFIHADIVKNGKRLGSIDRAIPPDLEQLLKNRFGPLASVVPRKMVTLRHDQINAYLNILSHSLLPDYFPKGMTVHCYRHIVASTVIKEDPAGHIVAAQLLHDNFNQIVKTYGFMKQDEHVARYYEKCGFKGVFSEIGRIEREVEKV